MNAVNSLPTILVVDDEPANLILLEGALSPTYHVLTANNGTTALGLATSSTPPCIILLDIMMPDMDGYEVIQQLKGNSQTSHIPVIFVTARSLEVSEEVSFEFGAVDFITKPFRIRTVIAKVDIHVELFQQRKFMESLAQKQFKQLAQNAITHHRSSVEKQQAIEKYLYNIHQNEKRLRLTLSASDTEQWDWDLRSGSLLRSNAIDDCPLPNECEFGSTADFSDYIHPNDYAAFENSLTQHFLGDTKHYDVEFRLKTKSEAWKWCHGVGRIIDYNELGEPTRLLGTLRDISSRKKTDEKLKIIGKSYESTSDGIWIANAKFELIMINKAFTLITGYTDDDVIGRPFKFSNFEGQHEKFFSRAHSALCDIGTWAGEVINLRKNGEQYTENLCISAVFDDYDELTHYIGVFSDISLRKKSDEDLRRLANYDPLTGLPNRALFIERLEQEFRKERLENYQFALLFLDLDDFKKTNDLLGHDAGDELLKQVSTRFFECCRSIDTVARLGGDEFTFILQDIEGIHVTAKTAQRILDVLKEPIEISNSQIMCTASIGIATYPRDGKTIGELMRHADTAMYSAKSKGKNSYQYFDQEMKDLAIARLELENDLRNAVNNEEIVLYYQPKVNFESGCHDGVEVLVRWQHPKLGFLPPDKFIPLAEDTGLIISLGEYILRTACYQYKEWQDKGIINGRLAVNVSCKQFMQPDFSQQVDSILKATGLDGKYLELEITESMLIQDTEKAIEVMNALREINIEIAIDDFGTGYSSLSYLSRFPVNTLKIDRSFITDITTSSQNRNIVKSIISLGHSLNLNIVIEGVETIEQANEVREMDAKEFQGFLFSRPLPTDKCEKFLKDNVNLYKKQNLEE